MYELILIVPFIFITISILFYTLKLGITPTVSNKKAMEQMLSLSEGVKKDVIVDFGSGFGFLAIAFAKSYRDKRVEAYELSTIPFLCSIFLRRVYGIKNLKIYKKDFLEVEIEKNSLILCFLFPKAMQRVEELVKNCEEDFTVISNTFAFNTIEYEKKVIINDIYSSPIYLYRVVK